MEIIELPPSCTWCGEFRYKKDAEKIYRCKINCECSNDIFELFENCPYIERKYGIRETKEENHEE